MFNCSSVQPLVASQLYWSPMTSDFVKLPDDVEKEINSYTEEFEKLKHPRKLKWLSSAGSVEIELEFDEGETMQMTVPPICYSTWILQADHYE